MTSNLLLNWNKGAGLIPTIIQDARTLEILMLGYMSPESLAQTEKTGQVTFFSRSRQAIWVKGETSGNMFNVIEIMPDCDRDALLIRVNPQGPACHRNTTTCFEGDFDFLTQLQQVIQNRFAENSSDAKPTSYIARLKAEGLDRMIQKVGEEAIETVIASKNDDLEAIENEAADLVFHLMVLLQQKTTSLDKVVERLRKRHLARQS